MGCGQGAYDFESTRGIFYLAASADFGATGEGALLFSVTSIILLKGNSLYVGSSLYVGT